MVRLPFLLLLLITATAAFAQPRIDSVIVSGQVRRLSAKLYRQSPTVLVTRTNMLRGGIEQAFPAPLQPNGTFRVAVPIVYPQEEMQFIIGNATTPFLASAGNLTITLDNDSLYVAALPFQFGGVNAQVNQQYAQFKAFEAKNKPDENARKRTLKKALNGDINQTFSTLYPTFIDPFTQFSTRQTVFPLVRDWAVTNARYDAAAYVFDKALQEQQTIPPNYFKAVTTDTETLLTASRAIAMSRFGAYADMRIQQNTPSSGRGIRIRTLAQLIDQYGTGLTVNDRQRLAAFRETNTARTADVRYLSKLLERNPDTLTRLLTYENAMQTARPLFDSLSMDYLKGYAMNMVITESTLDIVQVVAQHIYPQIGNPYLKQSFSDLLGQALRDTALVRQVRADYLALEKQPGVNSGYVGDGIYVTAGTNRDGSELLKKAVDQNRGHVIYVVLWGPGSETGRQLARDAQRLRDVFLPQDLTILYISTNDADEKLWLESIVRNRLKGEHIRLSESQTYSVFNTLNLSDPSPVRIILPQGKLFRKEALLPDKFDQLVEQIQAQLR
ncbi:hypothetical protein [Fibrella forsythiae]|uniref:Thioredoxin domain-containing protein n=1 Tax=Fibrella forsythiae TaxID=2817061 RepID=A0ABS3JPV9_9BACT|nr:hypothetical protein [Fibrella forsythiae]MBO0952027.1 hypothetical protein [Fibrella forsythiae]